MPLSKAVEMAKEQELDLVEITQNVKPPIVKIIAFDKFRYQKEKEFKKQKLAQKGGE
jgi:translation initiation factor IF-3